MTGKGSSRWADDEEDAALEAQRKKEKEEKKRAKAEKQRKLDEAAALQRHEEEDSAVAIKASEEQSGDTDITLRPAKRRRLSPEQPQQDVLAPTKLLRFPAPEWKKCRSVENYDKLNDIEEGAYGWVSRAKDLSTGKVVALKRLKMDNAADGIPVTGLREIQTLMDCDHPNIVTLQEVVVGENTEKIENIFLVLDFLEHDLKTLLTTMPSPFLTSELKTLLHQLLSGLSYLHTNWILHRDLKTSNLLLSNRGILKIADFGMARYYGSPPPQMTQLVVTLWYRSPELLLGTSSYGVGVDLWSVGCIFAELVSNDPLFQGKNEVDQLTKIFSLCGIPTETTWPGYKRLPNARSLRLPSKSPIIASTAIRTKFPFLSSAGSNLLTSLLSLNPADRPSAQEALGHVFFREDPKMKSTKLFPTFPSKAGLEKRRIRSPNAPIRGAAPELGGTMTMDFSGIFGEAREEEAQGGGFALKLV